MFKKPNPVLQYESAFPVYPNILEPAVKNIPDWYKGIPRWEGGEMHDPSTNDFNITVKHCMPFLDSLTAGYFIKLPYDVYVDFTVDPPITTWTYQGEPILGQRGKPLSTPIPPAYSVAHLFWRFPLTIKAPKGYSFIVTHPFNRHDLPFLTYTGIVSGGWAMTYFGALPFLMRDGFKGTIPQGTPIAQVIPFKEDMWDAQITPGLKTESEMNGTRSTSVLYGWYKKTHWSKKTYN